MLTEFLMSAGIMLLLVAAWYAVQRAAPDCDGPSGCGGCALSRACNGISHRPHIPDNEPHTEAPSRAPHDP
jgi:hypothetical protein